MIRNPPEKPAIIPGKNPLGCLMRNAGHRKKAVGKTSNSCIIISFRRHLEAEWIVISRGNL
jgi:hypothetical protein